MPDKTKDWPHLEDVAKSIDSQLPDGNGFCLFIFNTYPEDASVEKNTVRYVSNGKREDVILAMKAWLFEQGEGEDWMGHIE